MISENNYYASDREVDVRKNNWNKKKSYFELNYFAVLCENSHIKQCVTLSALNKMKKPFDVVNDYILNIISKLQYEAGHLIQRCKHS